MLSRSQLEEYDENGYVILENFLTPDDTKGVIEEYEHVIDQRAKVAQAEGRITSTYEDEPFEKKFVKLAEQVPNITSGLDIMQVRGPKMFEFLHNPKMLDVMESIFGPEILCSPVQHVRIVTPSAVQSQSVGAAKAWHQDYAVLWPEADGYLIGGLWIPLVDADFENGCLEIFPKSHKLGPLPHRKINEVETVPEAVPKTTPLTVPLKAGSALLLRNYVVHRGRANVSKDRIRWSLDLRYQHPYTPTGRPYYPSFIARSKMKPDAVLNDYEKWTKTWEFALASTEGVKTYGRWSEQGAVALPK